MLPRLSRRWFDLLWWLALSLYVIAGVPLATFHGDEPNHFYNSRDYAAAFIHGRPQDLSIDFSQPESGAYLRLSDSSVARYTIGFLWHLAGFTEADLPPRGWDWTQPYAANLDAGHRPPPALLNTGRLASALFLCLSIGIMFRLGWQFGARPLAYIVSALYTLNPIILLNGRRALQEGSLLFFGLLTVYIAVLISRRMSSKQPIGLRWWAGFVFVGGFALASKNSAFLYIGGALGWIVVAGILSLSPRAVLHLLLKLAASGLLMIALLVALSPGLWRDPITGLRRVWEIRMEQIQSQVLSVTPLTTAADRAGAILAIPFVEPVAHFELSGWGHIPRIQIEVAAYMNSPLSGLQVGILGGMFIAAMALYALLALLLPLEPAVPRALSAGIILWFALNVLVLMLNPLPWQRYYIPLIPIMSLLAGIGLKHLILTAPFSQLAISRSRFRPAYQHHRP